MSHENENNQTLISELSERLLNGIVKENPTFVLLLGMCPTLAVTTSAVNGLGMGVTTMVVLALSNLFISLLRKVIPNKIRIPAFIVIIASFVTIVELLLEGYITRLYDALGLYIPLIVVNCIILGRAESYAYSHKALPSLFDGIGMGMGFTFALTLIGGFRELLGAGTVFGARVMPASYVPVSIFIMAPGAFFVLAMLTAVQNVIKDIGEKRGKDMSKIQSGCGGNCMECTKDCKVSLVEETPAPESDDSKEENDKEKTVEEPALADTKVKEKTIDKSVDSKDSDKVEAVAETEPKTEENKSEETAAEKVTEAVKEESMELIDLSELKTEAKATAAAKKPKHKRASLEKAKAMLNKAEETMKEESND